ncbi:hypothetical protein J5J10_20625 [Ciceribacter sp. L1K23]|uniref:hypothetical protein n=1 Tax=unclassified Ciceribacter TaxID=2628820 RepID=UPI001ABED248|nr:hypothetical protein [Ciceribacter sp. L1K22]MBR0558104.1 hypothetical protein [Ciceribacter sp. L1K23]
MNETSNNNRSSAIAAAIIILVVGVVFYFLPSLVLWIGDYSPALAVAVGALGVMAFFMIFWVRSRFQKR